MARRLVIVLGLIAGVAAACGAFATAGDEPVPDGGVDAARGDGDVDQDDAAGATDAEAPPSASCDLTLPFAVISSIDGIAVGGTNAGAGALTPDELHVFYGVLGGQQPEKAGEIYTASRLNRGDAFSTPARLAGISTPLRFEGEPAIRGDGLVLAFTSDRSIGLASDNPGYHLYATKRAQASDAFTDGGQVFGDDYRSTSPFFAGLDLYLAAYEADGGPGAPRDLAVATGDEQGVSYVLPATTAFTTVNLPSMDDAYPVVTADGLTLYFASDRGNDGGGPDKFQIHVAHRSTTTVPFDPASLVAELADSTKFSEPNWISPDGCRLYYTTGTKSAFTGMVAAKP